MCLLSGPQIQALLTLCWKQDLYTGLRPAMQEPIKGIVIVNELTMSQSAVAQWHPTPWSSSDTKNE